MWEVSRTMPDDPKVTVSEILTIATCAELSMRWTEALQTFLQHCDELNERELVDWLV